MIVKLNPTLLGHATTCRASSRRLGYDELRVPEAAFARDTTWPQMCGFVERLGEKARSLGLGFGVKLTNTLDRREPPGLLPGDREGDVPLGAAAARAGGGAAAAASGGSSVTDSRCRSPRESTAATSPTRSRSGWCRSPCARDLLKTGGYGRAVGLLPGARRADGAASARRTSTNWVIRGHGQARSAP